MSQLWGYNVRNPVTSVVIRMFKGKAPNKPGYFNASELIPASIEVTDQPNTKINLRFYNL